MVALAPGSAHTASPPESWAMADCPRIYTQAQHAHYTRAVYSRQKVSKAARSRVLEMRLCQHTAKARRNARALTRKLRNRYKQRKAATPFGAWAIPSYIVMCESKGNFRARNAHSSAGGAYQILDSTWYAHGGTHYADSHPAAVAPPAEQHKIAARIWASGGPGQWSCA